MAKLKEVNAPYKCGSCSKYYMGFCNSWLVPRSSKDWACQKYKIMSLKT